MCSLHPATMKHGFAKANANSCTPWVRAALSEVGQACAATQTACSVQWGADKFAKVLALCDQLHVQHQPAKLDGVWVVPIHSWYHASWDAEPDIPDSADITQVSAAVLRLSMLSSAW